MLTLTRGAAHAIRELTDEAQPGAGLRIHAASRFYRGDVPPVQIEITPWPDVEDTILEAEGARLFVEPETLRTLDDKVLDAQIVDNEPWFAILEPAEHALT